MTDPAACLRVGVVGAGRVGAVLGAAWRAAGHEVTAVSAVSEASRTRAALLLPGVPVLPAEDVVREGELVLLAVPDDALAEVAARLPFRPGQVVVHCSGRHGTQVLAPVPAVQALALHPVLPFTGSPADLDRLAGAAFGVTAAADALPLAEQLVRELGGVPVRVPEESRTLWHAALAHGANHLVTLVSQVADLLRQAGADDPAAVLGPLLRASLDGALMHGDGALTGPVSRGDAGTVAAHLDVLPDEARALYTALSSCTVARAVASGRLAEGTALTRVLAEAVGVIVARTREELAAARKDLRGRVAVVMTMGALHEGHAALVRAAREQADSVVATVFVNPLQFAAGEDLDTYPRTLDADLALLEAEGADVVFTPTPEVVYPSEPLVRVSAGPIGDGFEGASRPGHFDGVLTVVLKLMHLTQPDVALFGQKDAQQLAAIRRMVRDLDVPVQVVAVPTVREADGLALSSRNRYLSDDERQTALLLSQALQTRDALAGRALFDGHPVELDYLEVVDSTTFEAAPDGDLMVVAAKVGTTRLIDNLPLKDPS